MQHFEQELDDLKQLLLAMAAKAKAAVAKATRAVVERDDRLAEEVKAEDDVLDQLEIEVDDRAVLLLSKAPMASQLRLITVALKVGQNLERIGDEATTIARRALELTTEPQLKPYIDIPRLSHQVLGMIDDALAAFVARDVANAAAIVQQDKEIDELNRQLHRELSSFMVEDPRTITRCLSLMVISKSLERIADHASNIAEEVIFLFEARDIRHSGKSRPKG
jgi:phosphate transport system protein